MSGSTCLINPFKISPLPLLERSSLITIHWIFNLASTLAKAYHTLSPAHPSYIRIWIHSKQYRSLSKVKATNPALNPRQPLNS